MSFAPLLILRVMFTMSSWRKQYAAVVVGAGSASTLWPVKPWASRTLVD